jgi:hypothetical protein
LIQISAHRTITVPYPMMRTRRIAFLAFVALLAAMTLRAQSPVASSGRDFRIALPSLAFGTGGPQWMRINVTATNTATVTLQFHEYGTAESVTLGAGQRWERLVPIDSIMLLQSEHRSDRSIHLTSTEPVTVNVVNDGSFISDGYCALPTESLGFDYVAMSLPGTTYTTQANTFGGVVAVLATQDGTTVRITPSVLTEAGNIPGVAYAVTLDAGEVYQVRPANPVGTDMTGTRIAASRPVAVFSGHRGVATDSVSAINSLIEEMVPTSDWGRTFYAMKLPEQSVGRYRVYAQSAGTEVRLNGLRIATLGAAGTFDIRVDGAAKIETSHPAMLVQLGTHRPTSAPQVDSDPSMAIVNPVDSYSEIFQWSTPTMPARAIIDTAIGWKHWATITAPTSALASVRLDGAPVSFSIPHGDGLYATAIVAIVAGPHRVSAAQPVNVAISGDSHYDAYAMPAGMRLREPFRAAAVVARTCGSTLDTVVTLFNFGGDQIEVTSLAFTAASGSRRLFPDPPFLVAAGGTRDVGIRISLPEYGRVVDTLTVTTTTSGSRPLIIPIEIWRDSLAVESIETTVDAGAVSASNPTRDTVVHLVNTGTGPVTIAAVTFSGPFRLVSPSIPATFAPSDTLALRIRFAPAAPGAATGSAVVALAPCGAPVTIDLAGRRLRGAGIELRTVVVPDVGCASPDFVDVPVVVRSVGEEPLRFDSIEVRGPGAAAFSIADPPAGTMIAPGDSIVATLRFAPPAAGVYTISLRVWNGTSPGGYLLSEPFEARRVSVVPALSRTSIDFGTLVGCGGDSLATITLFNHGTTAMTVAGLSTRSPAFALMTDPGFTVAPGDSAVVTIRFGPNGGGAFADTLTIAIAPCDTVLRVPLGGSRAAASIASSVDTLDFGTIATCALPSSASVRITNSGSVAVALRAASIDGNGFALTALDDSTLEPGASATVIVALDGATGPRTGTLVVRAEPCGLMMAIPLRAVVTRASLALTGSLDFGGLAPDVTSTRTVVLRNDGTADVAVDGLSLSPPVAGLTIESPPPGFVLAAGRDTPIVVSYRSSTPASFASTLLVTSSAPCALRLDGAASGEYSAEGAIALSLPDTAAPIDALVDVPLSAHRIAESDEALTVRAEIRWNRSMLALERVATPLAGTLTLVANVVQGAERVVTIEYTGVVPRDGVIATLGLRVLVGDSDRTALRFGTASARSAERGDWSVSTRDGSFTTLGICPIGGGRYARIVGTVVLRSLAPNPARSSAILSLDADAPASVVVAIVDALGRRVATPFAGDIVAGPSTLPVDLAGLASGRYQIEVVSAGRAERIPFILVR